MSLERDIIVKFERRISRLEGSVKVMIILLSIDITLNLYVLGLVVKP